MESKEAKKAIEILEKTNTKHTDESTSIAALAYATLAQAEALNRIAEALEKSLRA